MVEKTRITNVGHVCSRISVQAMDDDDRTLDLDWVELSAVCLLGIVVGQGQMLIFSGRVLDFEVDQFRAWY